MYAERHHIIPRSLGGGNDSDNLVYVTGREHFVLHRILTRCYEGESKNKMVYALFRMCHGQPAQKNSNSRDYELLRQQYSELKRRARLGCRHTEETKRKIGDAHRNKVVSEETKRRISLGNAGKLLGYKRSDKNRQNISRGLLGTPKSQEHINKINRNPEKIRKTAEKHTGMKRSPEARARMSAAAKGRIPWNKRTGADNAAA
jgi:hypothetical protein